MIQGIEVKKCMYKLKGRRGPTFLDYLVKAKSIRETIPKGRGKDSISFDRSPTPKE